jgi:hypothetical protein
MTGRKTRARVIYEMLQLACNELDAAKAETDVDRIKERIQLADRMIADALVSVHRWEVRG